MKASWSIPIIVSILFLGGIGLSQDVFASDGSVQATQKITEGVGGFTGDLGAEDFFSPVAGIGDINNDGVPDLAVGAPGDDEAAGNAGAVYILFMKEDGTVSSFQKITEGVGGFTGDLDATDYFGVSVEGLGDLDGDGVEDIAVGASHDDDGDTNRGAVWILFLDADGTVKDSDTDGTKISDTAGDFTGTLSNDNRFAGSIANIGDLDNDGIIDIAVGASRDDDGDSDRGAVWIFFLGTDGKVDGFQKISDTAGDFTATIDNFDLFGASVTGIGDLDGDGIEDIVVGAPDDDDTEAAETQTGAVYILFLGIDGKVDGFQKISDTAGSFSGTLDANDRFGETVTRAGDLNGDGVEDILVGAPGDDDAASRAGAVWTIFLDNDGTTANSDTDGVKITESVGGFTGDLDGSDDFGGGFAFAITQGGSIGIADIDCDNTNDLIVGAIGDDDAGSSAGAIYVLFMGLRNGSCATETTSSSGKDSSAPTLGTSSTGKRLIENGFTYNNNPIDVENFKTHYPLVRTPVGEKNTLDLKVLENQGMNAIWFVSVHFGVPQVNQQGEVMVTYYPGKDMMKIHDPNNLLADIDITMDPVKCKESDSSEKCVNFALDHTFNEAPIHDIVRVTLADKTRNHSDVFFNDGVEVFGDSLNPPATTEIASPGKDRGILYLTQTDRVQEIWVDQYDNTWSKNSMGSFIQQPLEEFTHPDDNPIGINGYKRIHSHFDTYKLGQELNAKQVWNGILIQSELPESFETPAYGAILGSENPALRINDVALQKDMQKQIERANQKLNAPEQSLEDYGIFVEITHDPIIIPDEILFAKDFSGFKDKKLSEIENALKLHEQKITKEN